jgi:hypothetical protein
VREIVAAHFTYTWAVTKNLLTCIIQLKSDVLVSIGNPKNSKIYGSLINCSAFGASCLLLSNTRPTYCDVIFRCKVRVSQPPSIEN